MHLRHQHRATFLWRCLQDNCYACFQTITGLLQHCASHGRESYIQDPSGRKQRFICSICKMTIDTLDQLMDHTVTHPDNKFSCDECGWHFNFIHALAIHGRDCHDTRQYACQWYPDYFKTAEELLQHIRSKHHFECTSLMSLMSLSLQLKNSSNMKRRNMVESN